MTKPPKILELIGAGAFSTGYPVNIESIILNKKISAVASDSIGYFNAKLLFIPYSPGGYINNYVYGTEDTLIFQENGGINVNFVCPSLSSIRQIIFEEGIVSINNSTFLYKNLEETLIYFLTNFSKLLICRYSLSLQAFPAFCVSGDTPYFLKSVCVFALKGSKEVVKHLFSLKPPV